MGRVTKEGCWASCRIVCNATLKLASWAMILPALVLRSKRGELLLEISSRILCPALKTLLVTHRSME